MLNIYRAGIADIISHSKESTDLNRKILLFHFVLLLCMLSRYITNNYDFPAMTSQNVC